MGGVVAILILWCVLGGAVGFAIGTGKGRGTEGFWWGFALGWIGWIVVGVMSPSVEAEARRQLQVADSARRMSNPAGSEMVVPNSDSRRLDPGRERPKSVVNERIRAEAATDSSRPEIESAVDHLESRQRRDVSAWLFVSGSAPLLVVLDGLNVGVGAARWDVLSRQVDHGRSPDGAVMLIRFGTTMFTDPRPTSRVETFLRAVRSVESPNLNSQAAELASRLKRDVEAPKTDVSPAEDGTRVNAHSAEQVRESLRSLDALREDGLINESEYDKKRSEILDRL